MNTRTIWHRFIRPVSSFFRAKRSKFLMDQIGEISEAQICDVGGSRHFWESSKLPVSPENLVLVNIDEGETNTEDSRSIYDSTRLILYDGNKIPFSDNFFDLVICNSVIEHVEIDKRSAFVSELCRVGKTVFLQTPCASFPIEPHFVFPFFHWLPKHISYKLVKFTPWYILSRPNESTVQSYFFGTNLLTMEEIQTLFADWKISYETFLGLKKSWLLILKKSGH